MKSAAGRRITRLTMSPLAEGRELKLVDPDDALDFVESPLAEGRELK